jgi:hypothetical protein
MLPVSLDCLLLIATSVFCFVFLFCLSSFRLVLNVACVSGFSIIDLTTIKAKEQHSKQKGQPIIENPETQATLSTRRNEDKQNKNTIQKTEFY